MKRVGPIYNKFVRSNDKFMSQLTKTYTDKNETGCCPVPNVSEWDGAEVVWENKRRILSRIA
ncbi:MAG: hypothetical protein COT91_01035 [Candidatus Doudnabacteria bacterium CG10_big_fil_rev_8_21_14_0_10_41_10]|uniref:Uncharacterized protein n=1 Tax=Candidatus Doudnabacteria bacterium CG10_big_fil_rev_8_21_14_0_10_41_10 TaxID=1974551 RepID=A0A2H0VEK8_9BACT|nr:MAG: hypothetical protein COT91_01035 [Candidatus Doudnabacteria bacterium CG10_big_fil_rev_8_21_14_0_10_41_10]